MFENLFTNIKNQTSKVSNSFENLRDKTSKLSESVKAKLQSNSIATYLNHKDDNSSDYSKTNYLSPRASDYKNKGKSNLDWPVLIDHVDVIQNEYYISDDEEVESEDIVDRFMKVITIDDVQRRTDREEIRRRLAMGSESDDYYTPGDRPGRKPSLQARLQSGMNLQICFMNETVSDSDSPNSDNESTTITTPASTTPNSNKPISRVPPYHKPATILANNNARIRFPPKSTKGQRPLSLPLINEATQLQLQALAQPVTEADFFARQARLQIEARMALAQAKEMAHMQMEVERQRQKKSPITEMVRCSLEKVGIQFPEERRRVSRQILTEMNVAQLQVIVNDLHTQIEALNEGLVRFLMDRDDLHMEQDSMLVDIEDLTRYLGAKEKTVNEKKQTPTIQTSNNNIPPPSPLLSLSTNVIKPRLHRIASLVKK